MGDLRIIFMGTPDFAVPGLQALVEQGKNVVAVITAPDKPAGRGQKFQMSAVKEKALEYQIPVLQPVNLKAPEFIDALKTYRADLQVVVAFRMLPEAVWAMPPLGTFNLHASLLPQYRGAAPINWAIMNGEVETGVTTFFLQHEIDTGHIIYQEKESILPDDTFESLYHKLMHRGASLIVKTVEAIERHDCPSTPQENHAVLKTAPKIHKETCAINWNSSSQEVRNFIRGLSPYPAAWTVLNNKTYKIFRVSVAEASTSEAPKNVGAWETDDKSYLKVHTAGGAVLIEELQAEGKKKMTIVDYLRGNKI